MGEGRRDGRALHRPGASGDDTRRPDFSKVKEYLPLETKTPILMGASVGSKIAMGKAHVILDAKHIGDFRKGEILVTTMTDPDWEPIMKMASAIVTDKGGRTSHAAIVSRELAFRRSWAREKATKLIKTGDPITVDTTGSAGNIYRGFLKFKVVEHDLKKIPQPKTKIMVNVAIPDSVRDVVPAERGALALRARSSSSRPRWACIRWRFST